MHARRTGLVGAAALALLTGCTLFEPVGEAEAVGEEAARRGARCGVDRAGLDRAVAPTQDFYAYATGGWSGTPDIRAALEASARQQLAGVSTPADRFVAAYLARDPRDAAGARVVLDGARALIEERDREVLAEAAALAALRGGTTPFRVSAVPDPEAPARTTLIVSPGGAPLGSLAAYDEYEGPYRDRIAATLSLLGAEDAEALAGHVVTFERQLAEALEAVEPDYSRREVDALRALRAGDPWDAYFQTLGTSQDEVTLRDIGALSRTAAAWRNGRRDAIGAYLAFHRVSDVADFLPPEYGGVRDEARIRGYAEQIFAAEEGAALRGAVTPATRALAERVAQDVMGGGMPVIVAGGSEPSQVPEEALSATAAGVEAAALARGRARLARAGRETVARERLSSSLSAQPRIDPATGVLDLPAALLQGPVFATGDPASAYGALGTAILRSAGLSEREALRRAHAAFSAAGEAGGLCGMDAERRFFLAYAQGALGGDARAVNAAVREMPAWHRAFGGNDQNGS